MECIADTCLCGILFWAFGFAFMFGTGNGFIGHEFFFLNNAPATYGTTGVAFLAFFLFQFAFADTCSTITSGAMVGRTAFGGDLLYSFGVSGFIYPIFGHWIWGPDGWLATMDTPFRDFAGSTVVHTIGGIIALAGAIALGPRLGRKFKRDGGGMPPGHDMTIAAIGGVILWFGWYGFNPGSTLSAMDFGGIGRVADQHDARGVCGRTRRDVLRLSPRPQVGHRHHRSTGSSPDSSRSPRPCYWVSPFGAICIGAIAGVVVVLAVDLIEWLRVDDPIGAVAVHGFCGIWGTLSLGLFATGQYGLPGPTGADTSTHRSRACSTAAAGSSSASRSLGSARHRRCARSRSACSLMYGDQGARRAAGLAKRSSSGASTSTSTARRRTTRSPRTWATRRSRRAGRHRRSTIGTTRRRPAISVGRLRRTTCISSRQSSSRIGSKT